MQTVQNGRSLPIDRRGRVAAAVGTFTLLLTSAYAAQDSVGNTSPQAAAAPKRIEAPADVSAIPRDAITTPSGIAMEILKPGSGNQHPAGDDCVVLTFTAWKRDGSLFSTSGAQGESVVQCLTTAIPGISEALRFMVAGEKRRVWVPSQLGFATHIAHHGNKKMPENPSPKPPLTVDVELISVLKSPAPPHNLKKPPATALKTPSGVAIEVLYRGTATQHPTMSSRVTVNYSGWTKLGKLFETTVMSGHPAVVLLGMALPGWREALPYMVAGEKARIWIPAALAYGETPADNLLPAGDLVYEVELLEISDNDVKNDGARGALWH